MPLKIAVCIKSVPDPDCYDDITLDPIKKTLVRDGIPTVINTADKHALEEALRLRDQLGGEISVLSMGPPNARQQLLEALAMGADKAFLISDRKVGGADTLATSYTLSKLVEKTGPYDVIFAGNESADGATAHVPSQLGVWLGIGHASNVMGLQNEDSAHMIVTKQFENGRGRYRLAMPCVIAVNSRINEVRHTNVMAALKAKNKPMVVMGAEELEGLDDRYIGLNGSPSQNGELEMISSSKNCKMLEGTEEEIAEAIMSVVTSLSCV